MNKKYIACLILFIFLQGCQKDVPEPEVKFHVIPMSTIHAEHDMPVLMEQRKDEFLVQHHVKGNSVFVECMVSNISFRDNSKKQGKIIVHIDGKKKEEITSAAFIIKGLTKGTHHVKLEIVNLQNEPFDLQKEFTVSIS